MTQQPDNFDHLLDKALQSYASAEPRIGLEGRILAHVTSRPAASQHSRLLKQSLLWAGLAAICLAVAATILLSNRHAPEQKQEIARSIPSSTLTARPAVVQHTTPHIERAAMQRPHLKATRQYGRPQPTQQDRLFVEFVTLHRQDALDLAKQQQTPDQPISDQPIVSAPIVIAPITMDSKDQSSF